jgi:hypothetical protein
MNNMKKLLLPLSVFLAFLAISCTNHSHTNITIRADQERYRMAGGIGASWHAISEDSIDESPDYKWALRTINSRGSAWGGNPPVTSTDSWEQIYKHASWLGFTWIRVEMSARMYEPERNVYSWDNEEMMALYKILDWAEANKADVFLQQMWSNVKWNSYPSVQPLLSAPRSIPDFAEGMGNLLDHLINVKKYTCIKWVCLTNEPPGGSWGSWWSTGETDALLTPALQEVRKVLDQKNLSIPISGPDWTDLPVFDSVKIDFDQYIGSYDIHSYQGIDVEKQKILTDWANWAKKHNKPLFLSELGDMRIGWKDTNPGPKSFNAALSNAESILRGLEAGVSAFNRWSFTNRGDLDGQWQLIRTWDREKKQYYEKIEVEPAAFYGYGIITRFAAKNSTIVTTEQLNDTAILSQTLKSPKGELTIFILNKSDREQTVNMKISGSQSKIFFLYMATEEMVNSPVFRMDPYREINIKENKAFQLKIPPRSISTLSNMKVSHDDPAINR